MKGILIATVAILAITYFGWKFTARTAYESAEYAVLESEDAFEIRRYPDLVMATSSTAVEPQGQDDRFMRLFRYIGGANDREQKVAMTTPVFMETDADDTQEQMGFVIPKKVTEQRVPEPTSDGVQIKKRDGGRFAVIRFAGRLDDESLSQNEAKLRTWIEGKNIVGDGAAEVAGYDAPWTPGPLRRNEILIRLK